MLGRRGGPTGMEKLFSFKYSYLIPLLPLIGACVSGFFGAKWLKQQSHWPIWLGVGASAVLSFLLLFGMFHYWGDVGQPPSAVFVPQMQEVHPTLSTTSLWYEWARAGDPKNAGTKAFF